MSKELVPYSLRIMMNPHFEKHRRRYASLLPVVSAFVRVAQKVVVHNNDVCLVGSRQYEVIGAITPVSPRSPPAT